MENLVNGSQTERSVPKSTPARVGQSRKATIPLHSVTDETPQKQKRHNYFYYQRGKTKIECEGTPDKAIKVALVDTISRWIVRLMIGGTSILITHATAQKVLRGIKSPLERKPISNYQKNR